MEGWRNAFFRAPRIATMPPQSVIGGNSRTGIRLRWPVSRRWRASCAATNALPPSTAASVK